MGISYTSKHLAKKEFAYCRLPTVYPVGFVVYPTGADLSVFCTELCIIQTKLHLLIKYILLFAFLLFFYCSFGQNQENDTTSVSVKKHSPTRASLFSTVIPGLGQAYNKKYWKVPVIYAGFGALFYFAIDNNKEYQKFKDAYEVRTDTNSTAIDVFANTNATLDDIIKGKDRWRRYRDLDYIGIAVLYILNIVDASVDAHFFDYDISDDLSLRIEPYFIETTAFNCKFGLKCCIKF